MVVIRLARRGSHKRPFYAITVADKRAARDGKFLERVGYFNPLARGQEQRLHVDQARVAHWIAQGAQPSDRVKQLISDANKDPQLLAEQRQVKLDRRIAKRQAAKQAATATASATS